MTNYSIYRPSVALRLPVLQVLDGERVTLEERTRAELLSTEEIVKTTHNTHENRRLNMMFICCESRAVALLQLRFKSSLSLSGIILLIK